MPRLQKGDKPGTRKDFVEPAGLAAGFHQVLRGSHESSFAPGSVCGE